MATKKQVAAMLRNLSYDMIGMAIELANMQKSAIEDGWCWQPNEAYGEFGMAQMLRAWAESQE